MRRCKSEGFAPAGYFEEVIGQDFNSPEPVRLQYDSGLTKIEHSLLQHNIIPGDVGLEAGRAILKASRVTGVKPEQCLVNNHSGRQACAQFWM